MEKYIKLDFEVVKFENDDIIITSGGGGITTDPRDEWSELE